MVLRKVDVELRNCLLHGELKTDQNRYLHEINETNKKIIEYIK